MYLLFSALYVLLQINLGSGALCPYLIDDSPNLNDLLYYMYSEPGTSSPIQLNYDQLDGIPHKENVAVIAHGFTDDAWKPWILEAKEQYFKAYDNSNVNVILVDWSNITSSYDYTNVKTNLNLVYPRTAYRTCKAGEFLAKILIEINKKWGIPFSKMTLTGHSLGAHLVGCAGQAIATQTGEKVDCIIGIDPAGPMFGGINPDCRFSEDDATFTQAVITNAGVFGYPGSIAKVNFFPNGGKNQPGCLHSDLILPDICDHCYSYHIVPASFTTSGKGFEARKCSDYISYESGLCESNPVSQMGFYADRSASGDYYLDTTADPPYIMSGARTSASIIPAIGK